MKISVSSTGETNELLVDDKCVLKSSNRESIQKIESLLLDVQKETRKEALLLFSKALEQQKSGMDIVDPSSEDHRQMSVLHPSKYLFLSMVDTDLKKKIYYDTSGSTLFMKDIE